MKKDYDHKINRKKNKFIYMGKFSKKRKRREKKSYIQSKVLIFYYYNKKVLTRKTSPKKHTYTQNMGGPRGIHAARKLKTTRRLQRWADKTYNKAHLPSKWTNPFGGASHAKGIVVEKV